jgi:oxygen-dependent protoporphyrinogen oxidase
VSRIARRNGGYEIHTAAGASIADQVVICAQPYAAADMVANLDFELANQLAAIEYSPVAVVGMGFRSLAHTLDGFGLLTTTAARLNILGVLWDSSIFPDRAPPQCKAVRVMIGGQRNPELVGQDEAGLIATAREGIAVTMGIDQEPDVVFVKRWERGIASYTPGHVARMDALFARLSRHAGLHLTCNAYRGIAMNDSVRNARELAMRIAAQAAGQEAA